MVHKQGAISKSTCLPIEIEKKVHSDPELQSSRHWTIHAEGFPPGLTVDELKQYRKKRPPHFNRPLDNLHVEEGSLKLLKTEYVRMFKQYPTEDIMSSRVERKKRQTQMEIAEDKSLFLTNEYREAFQDFPRERPRIRRPLHNLEPARDVPMEFTTEKNDKHIPFRDAKRPQILRRSTALKAEGEMLTETEFQREFHAHEKVDRVRPVKRSSYLHLEGLFENLTSEQKENYVAYLVNQRPRIQKRQTQLRLEGDLDLGTENAEKYIPLGSIPRPMLIKRSTSLKLDGEVEFWPEYQRSFVDFPRARPTINKPEGQLNITGDFQYITENRSKFINHSNPAIAMSAKTANNLQLEGKQETIPEYREQFIKYGRSKSDLIKRNDNLTLEGNFNFETEKDKYQSDDSGRFSKLSKEIPAAGLPTHSSHRGQESNSQQPLPPLTQINVTPEYRSQYIDFPRKRPSVKKPTGSLVSTGDLETATEKQSQYHSYGTIPREHSRRRPGNLSLEGSIEGSPEYRTSYIEFPVSYQRQSKPPDTFIRDYPSFQVLEVSGKENVNGPEEYQPSIRKSSIASEQPPSPSQASSISRPTFRLEVHNAGESKGFHRSPERIFPKEAVVNRSFPTEKHQAALEAAMKRKETFERENPSTQSSQRVKSRPNSVKSKYDENGNDRSFVVLDDVNSKIINSGKIDNLESITNWEPPVWMENSVSQAITN